MAQPPTDEEPWKSEIQDKLLVKFGDNRATDLVRILVYLANESAAYENSTTISPVWRILRTAASSDTVFNEYAERLAKDTLDAENDSDFLKVMAELYERLLSASENPVQQNYATGFELITNKKLILTDSASTGFVRAWAKVPRIKQAAILKRIPQLLPKASRPMVRKVFSQIKRVGQPVVVLSAIYLTIDAAINIYLWSKGKITGKRCAKNIINASVSLFTGFVVGAIAGSFCGPYGAIVGGFVGSAMADALCNLLAQRYFDIPIDVSLENAYAFLEVSTTANNVEINAAYRRLCLIHHPDKGGSAELFLELQSCMGIIKVSRGETFEAKKSGQNAPLSISH